MTQRAHLLVLLWLRAAQVSAPLLAVDLPSAPPVPPGGQVMGVPVAASASPVYGGPLLHQQQ